MHRCDQKLMGLPHKSSEGTHVHLCHYCKYHLYADYTKATGSGTESLLICSINARANGEPLSRLLGSYFRFAAMIFSQF